MKRFFIRRQIVRGFAELVGEAGFAVENQIANPRALTAGQQILVPFLPYRDPQTGEVIG